MNKCQICKDTNKYVLEVLHENEVRYMCSVQWNEMISNQFAYEPDLAEQYYVLPEGCSQHPAEIPNWNECDGCAKKFATSNHPTESYQTPHGAWYCSPKCDPLA